MKKLDVAVRYGWLFCLLLSLLCFTPLILGITLPYVFSDWGIGHLGLFIDIAAIATITFTLVYGVFLLYFPKRQLKEQKGSVGEVVGRSAETTHSTDVSRPISNPYERAGIF